jgi:hypothetical protein
MQQQNQQEKHVQKEKIAPHSIHTKLFLPNSQNATNISHTTGITSTTLRKQQHRIFS